MHVVTKIFSTFTSQLSGETPTTSGSFVASKIFTAPFLYLNSFSLIVANRGDPGGNLFSL